MGHDAPAPLGKDKAPAFLSRLLTRVEPSMPYRREPPPVRRARKHDLADANVIAVQQTFRDAPPDELFKASPMTERELRAVSSDTAAPIPTVITHCLRDLQFSLPAPPPPKPFRPPPLRKSWLHPRKAGEEEAAGHAAARRPATYREATASWSRREEATWSSRLHRMEMLFGPDFVAPDDELPAPAPAPPPRTLPPPPPPGPAFVAPPVRRAAGPQRASPSPPRSGGEEAGGRASEPEAADREGRRPPAAFDEAAVVQALAAALAARDDAAFFAAYDELIPDDMPGEQVERLKERAREIAAGGRSDDVLLKRLLASGTPPTATAGREGSRRVSPRASRQGSREGGPGAGQEAGPEGRRRGPVARQRSVLDERALARRKSMARMHHESAARARASFDVGALPLAALARATGSRSATVSVRSRAGRGHSREAGGEQSRSHSRRTAHEQEREEGGGDAGS